MGTGEFPHYAPFNLKWRSSQEEIIFSIKQPGRRSIFEVVYAWNIKYFWIDFWGGGSLSLRTSSGSRGATEMVSWFLCIRKCVRDGACRDGRFTSHRIYFMVTKLSSRTSVDPSLIYKCVHRYIGLHMLFGLYTASGKKEATLFSTITLVALGGFLIIFFTVGNRNEYCTIICNLVWWRHNCETSNVMNFF